MDERKQSPPNINQGRGGGGPRATGTTTEITKVAPFLRGCNFPCAKAELVRVARANNAPSNVIEKLQALTDQQFASVDDVQRRL